MENLRKTVVSPRSFAWISAIRDDVAYLEATEIRAWLASRGRRIGRLANQPGRDWHPDVLLEN